MKYLVEYDPSTQQLTLKTGVPQPEYVAMGSHTMFVWWTMCYTIAAPSEMGSIIKQVYKEPALGIFQGASTIYKVLAKSFIDISCGHTYKLLPQMEVQHM